MIESIKIYGDQALLINFEQKIDPAINAAVIGLKNAIEQAKIEGITFLIPAYCSLTVGYHPQVIEYAILVKIIAQLGKNVSDSKYQEKKDTARQLRIPVCYESPYALDLQSLSEEKGITAEKIIELHTSQTFKVYMLGFLPGFVFMGKLPEALACNRKTTPRLRVPANSVGIAGFQTGIYPSISPGGWQIIGRTPFNIFNPKKEKPFLFQPQDEVSFYAISTDEFEQMKKENA